MLTKEKGEKVERLRQYLLGDAFVIQECSSIEIHLNSEQSLVPSLEVLSF